MPENESFNQILNECLDMLLTGDSTIAQCLERYPEYAAELKPLLETAVFVDRATDIKPSAEFKARAHYQLQLELAKIGTPRRPSFWRLQPRWALSSMAVMVVFLMGSGTVLAANSSMPGNILYPVKIATENLSIQLTGSDIEKAALYAALADRRVAELAYVVDNGKESYVTPIAQKFDATMSAMNALPLATEPTLSMSAAASGEFGAVDFTQDATDTSTAPPLMAAVPTITATAIAETTGNSTSSGHTTAPIGNTAAAYSSLTKNKESDNKSQTTTATEISEKDKLKQYIAYNAIHHPEKLKELMERAAERSRNTIQHMIDVSESNNRETLQKLDD